MHAYQAVLLAIWPPTMGATAITAMQSWVAMGTGRAVLVPVMLLCALLAVAGAVSRMGWVRILMFLPQHYLLGVAAFGGLAATLHGEYLDHTPMFWSHISGDQVAFSTLFGIHTVAIIRRARDPNG